MNELIWNYDSLDSLNKPVLVVAFKGLFDASGSATSALEWLMEKSESENLGEIDSETFFDFTQERPLISFDKNGERALTWPKNKIVAIKTNGNERDLLSISGIEPHLRWRTFSELLIEIVNKSNAESVITLGSMVGMTPHSRPLTVTGSSTNPELAERLHLEKPSYQGPTGIVGVLHDALDRSKIPVISLRVSVPHYVPDSPNPKATRALLRRFEQVTGVTTEYEELDGPAADWQKQVDAAVASDDEITAYVTRLETTIDEDENLLPSGDDLAAEFEAFLREQGPEIGSE
ncbi:MAG: PAC2 family protein [Acidimicrobiales bacterium]|nr:carboxylate--amine ligase [Acidimicrobiaceae bacterium]MDP6161745.1 PAC2 family protein [Acidimicrobiales bacterium]MDP6285658.1 PAC2 family protein [Acidimicrobiales bacterium]HJL91881.1 PAC2 family protein [Acidimicrobiales bacterium]HJO40848.1 PAC2 family protein [Acidimicrobiales bacterium]